MSDEPIRLACVVCDREDCDGITSAELAAAIAVGWQHVSEAGNGYPDDYSSDWWTHLGWCPECVERDSKPMLST